MTHELLIILAMLGSTLIIPPPASAHDESKENTRFVGFPPKIRERIVCSISAAAKYQIPANIMLAVAEMEGGTPGQWVLNSNGTHDVGPMQFNTAYLAGLARYGITASDVAAAGCYPFDLAAWRLRWHIKHDPGDLWTRVANYHSRTHAHNTAYRADLMVKADKWADWLAARFTTLEAAEPEATRGTSVYVPRKIIANRHP